MRAPRTVLLVAAALGFAFPLQATAVELPLTATTVPGADAVVEPAGTYGAVQVGWDPEPAGNVGTVSGDASGNAVVLTGVTDQVVQQADAFSITWVKNSVSQTANIDVTGATSVASYCALVDADPNLNCSVRPEGVQILTPFLSNIQSFSFTHGAVPGKESNLTVSGISDDQATTVNRFEIRIAGTLYSAPAGAFTGVSSVADLAVALDALPFVKTGAVSGSSIQILAEDFGPQAIADVKLDHFIPAVSPKVTFSNVSDADAALIDRVVLERDGVAVSQAGVDLSLPTDLATLAAQLDASPELIAQKVGADLVLQLLPAGAGAVTLASLNVIPALSGGASDLTYTEGDVALVDPTLTVVQPSTDVLASARIEVIGGRVATEDVLGVESPGALLVSQEAATGALILTGPGTLAEFEGALRSVTYLDSSEDPATTERTLQVTVSDADDTSPPLTYTVTPVPVNDAPVVTTAGGALLYTENQGALPLDDGLTLGDVDSPTLTGAVVQITQGYVPGEDQLAFEDTTAISGSFDPLTGTLTLSGTGTVAEFEAALRSVTYRDDADAPSGAQREVTFLAADSELSSAPSTRVLQLLAVDDPLTLSMDISVLDYMENGEVSLDESLSIADLDLQGLTGATVTLQGFVPGEDVLEATAGGAIAASWSDETGVLTLSGADSAVAYRDVLRTVRYRNLSEDPSPTPRTLKVSVASGATDVASASRGLFVVPQNDPPVLTLAAPGAEALTSDGSRPVDLLQGLELADPDNAQLSGATVRISSGVVAGEDFLLSTPSGGVSGTYDAKLARLTLSGEGTLDDYRAVLASVAYENASKSPTAGTRTLSVQLDDGEARSNIVTLQLQVVSPAEVSGCGCASSGAEGGFWLLSLLAGVALIGRRRRTS